MRNSLFIFLLLTCFATSAWAQPKPAKEYYDKDFKRVRQDKAMYYRMVARNDSGHAVGLVHDYYISGAKQWDGYLDFNDEPQGPATWYYENGQKQIETTCLHGLNIGNYKEWYPDGKLHVTGYYARGRWQTEKRGNWVYYFENGNIEMKLHYTKHRDGGSVAEDVRDSINSVYYPDGKLLATGYYFDDCSDGVGLYNDKKGEKHLIYISGWKEDIVNMYGRMAGLDDFKQPLDDESDSLKDFLKKFESMFPRQHIFECKEGKNVITDSGKNTRIEFIIKDDAIDGKCTKYSLKSGKVIMEGNYSKNARDGVWKHWYETGEFSGETGYKNGKLDGVEKIYFGDGKEWRESTYKNGMRNGISWDIETDDLTSKPLWLGEMAFKNDTEVFDYSCKTWYVDSATLKRTGIMAEAKKLDNGKTEMIGYFPNGKPEFIYQYDTELSVNMLSRGDRNYTTYYANGQKESEGMYKKNVDFIINAWDSSGKPIVINGNGMTSYKSYCFESNNGRRETYYRNSIEYKSLQKDDKGRVYSEDYKGADHSDSLNTIYFINGKKQQQSITDKPHNHSVTTVWDSSGHVLQIADETDTMELWEHTDEYQNVKREWMSRPLSRTMTAYYPNGQKSYEEITRKGRHVSTRQWDERGNIKESVEFIYDEFGNIVDKKYNAK